MIETKKAILPDHKELLHIFFLTVFIWSVLVAWAYVIDNYFSVFFNYNLTELNHEVTHSFRKASPDRFLDDLLWPWFQWDSYRYIEVSIYGYINKFNIAFAPLYSFVIRILGILSQGRYFLSAIFLSVNTTFISSWLIYKDLRNLTNARVAWRAVLYFLVFPSAFFMFGAYSEGLFLLLVLLSWHSSSKHQWSNSAFWASLAVLTRFQGIGLFVPLVYRWWKLSDRRLLKGGCLYLGIPSVFFAWAVFAHDVLGAPFPWQALELGWDLHFGWPWEGILNNTLNLLNIHPYWQLYPFWEILPITLFLDLVTAVLFLLLTFYVFKRLPLEYGLLMVVLLVPALTKVNHQGLLLSVSRYVLPLWPGFLILAKYGEKGSFHRIWFSISILFGLLASALFFMSFWIA